MLISQLSTETSGLSSTATSGLSPTVISGLWPIRRLVIKNSIACCSRLSYSVNLSRCSLLNVPSRVRAGAASVERNGRRTGMSESSPSSLKQPTRPFQRPRSKSPAGSCCYPNRNSALLGYFNWKYCKLVFDRKLVMFRICFSGAPKPNWAQWRHN